MGEPSHLQVYIYIYNIYIYIYILVNKIVSPKIRETIHSENNVSKTAQLHQCWGNIMISK